MVAVVVWYAAKEGTPIRVIIAEFKLCVKITHNTPYSGFIPIEAYLQKKTGC
jgi:hypothetical protein